MFEQHAHPLDPNEKVVGRHVEPGETLRSSDVEAAPTGKWVNIPYERIGDVVREDEARMFVRPA